MLFDTGHHTTKTFRSPLAQRSMRFLRRIGCALIVAGVFSLLCRPVSAISPSGNNIGRIAAADTVVINEINYNAHEDSESKDWVELYNAGATDVDLTGWTYSDADDDHVFAFPDGTILKSGEYLVAAQEIASFSVIHPSVSNAVGDAGFGLAGGGELVRIFDASGAIVDSLTYDDSAPWPEEADGDGYTLALTDPMCDNHLPECWSASAQMNGTPGAPNFPQSDETCPRPAEIEAIPATIITAEQVESGAATLQQFVLAYFEYALKISASPLSAGYLGCLLTHEGPWNYGSTYIATTTTSGTLALHGQDVLLTGGVVDSTMLETISAAAAMSQAGGAFEFMGDDGYAVTYFNPDGSAGILVAGLDIQASHVTEVAVAPGDPPAVTARDVVDRESLKAFVNGAADYAQALYDEEGYDAGLRVKRVFRDTTGYWRHGPTYLFIMDRTGYTYFHGAFPEKYELQAPTETLTDAVTGELILPQIIAAAASSEEGGFVTYHFDNPYDDSDSADIPKVTFAREYEFNFTLPNGAEATNVFIMGAGIYEDEVTSVEPVDEEIPAAFALEQNYPNPFNPSTTIEFSLERAQAITLTVYDVLGREVRVLADGVQPAGRYSVSFDGAGLAGGTYLYALRTGQHVSVKKMILLK